MPQAVSGREEAGVGARLEEPRSQDGEGRGGTEAAAVRTEKGNAASWQTRGKTDGKIWGRGGDRPDAGEKSGKNAVFDRPAPNCGNRKNDRDLVSRGTEQGAKDE